MKVKKNDSGSFLATAGSCGQAAANSLSLRRPSVLTVAAAAKKPTPREVSVPRYGVLVANCCGSSNPLCLDDARPFVFRPWPRISSTLLLLAGRLQLFLFRIVQLGHWAPSREPSKKQGLKKRRVVDVVTNAWLATRPQVSRVYHRRSVCELDLEGFMECSTLCSRQGR